MIIPIPIPWKSKPRLIVYTVHEPPNPPADRLDRGERLIFVKDGFNGSAAILGPIWLLTNRLWLAFAGYMTAMVALLGVLMMSPPEWIAVAIGFVHILIGFEADQLQRQKMEKLGYTLLGSVAGHGDADCERRFFEKWLPGQPILTRSGGVQPPPTVEAARGEASSGAAAGSPAAKRRRGGWFGWRRADGNEAGARH
jgi:hypothetical protein